MTKHTEKLNMDKLLTCPWQDVAKYASKPTVLEYSLALGRCMQEYPSDSPERISICSVKELFIIMPNLQEKNDFFWFNDEIIKSWNMDDLYAFLFKTSDFVIISHIAHLLWHLRSPKGCAYECAKIAISSYIKLFSKIRKTYPNEACEPLILATKVSLSLGKGGERYIKTIRKLTLNFLLKCNAADIDARALDLFQFAEKHCGGHDALAQAALRYSKHFDKNDNLILAKDFIDIAHKLNPNFSLLETKADLFVRHALTQESALGKSLLLKQAYKFYSHSGKKDKAMEVHRSLLEVQSKIPEEMKISYIELPVSKMEQDCMVKIFSSLSLPQALENLASIFTLPNMRKLEEQARKIGNQSLISHIATIYKVNSMGKTVAPPTNYNSEECVANYFLIKLYMEYCNKFRPALTAISDTNKNDINQIRELLQDHPFVPSTRINIFAKGLKTGLDMDFTNACHLLIPQLENSIRYRMATSKEPTSTMTDSGVQMERDLNNLLEDAWVINYLGENTSALLRFVFTEKVGFNLRNLLCHGLLEDFYFDQPVMAYAWWLLVKLLFVIRNDPNNPASVLLSDQ